ncbi:37110_t:CDS:2 [Gigaspora margarita]|uniref:37110_t:CDS:1 n=1 Tax=Gigaspora margarita TaxID=4874 RepID=A0ABN7UEM5_GIGMA|nr:37110_t:CDS:2 [Gigaspora margarita]
MQRVRAKEEELVKAQEASTQASSEDNLVEFMNPRKVTGKGRPKGTSHYSESTPQKTSSKKKREYTCGFCKEPDHNITTCPDRR